LLTVLICLFSISNAFSNVCYGQTSIQCTGHGIFADLNNIAILQKVLKCNQEGFPTVQQLSNVCGGTWTSVSVPYPFDFYWWWNVGGDNGVHCICGGSQVFFVSQTLDQLKKHCLDINNCQIYCQETSIGCSGNCPQNLECQHDKSGKCACQPEIFCPECGEHCKPPPFKPDCPKKDCTCHWTVGGGPCVCD